MIYFCKLTLCKAETALSINTYVILYRHFGTITESLRACFQCMAIKLVAKCVCVAEGSRTRIGKGHVNGSNGAWLSNVEAGAYYDRCTKYATILTYQHRRYL